LPFSPSLPLSPSLTCWLAALSASGYVATTPTSTFFEHEPRNPASNIVDSSASQ
jgi:hypothetical protein